MASFSFSVCKFLTGLPRSGGPVFIAPGAVLVGDVRLGNDSSVWYQAVLRADIQRITIGDGSNIQDGSVIHLSSELGTIVGNYVTCGHRAILHACQIGDEVLVGMGAIVMDGAVVGTRSIVGAGALVTRGMEIPEGSLVLGSPARVVRALSLEEQRSNRLMAEKYIQVAREHRELIAAHDGQIPAPGWDVTGMVSGFDIPTGGGEDESIR